VGCIEHDAIGKEAVMTTPAFDDQALPADPADLDEQRRPLVADADDAAAEPPPDADAGLEADPADLLDQLREVPVDDDYDR
jgi:hypothetical protein